MTVVLARRKVDDLRLEIDEASSLISGDVTTLQVSQRESVFAFMLVSSAPRVLRYEQVESDVLRPGGIAMDDPMTYIRKLKLAVDRSLSSATGQNGLISTVRGMGYRLAGEWDLSFLPAQSELAEAIRQMHMLTNRCIEAMYSMQLARSEGDDLVLVLDAAVGIDDNLIQRFYTIVPILREPAMKGSGPVPLERFDALLRDIASYFTFSRRGDVAEGLWRQLFENELRAKVNLAIHAILQVGSNY